MVSGDRSLRKNRFGGKEMKDILNAPFMVEMIRTATNMYDHGWDERNGGNISMLLDEAEVRKYYKFPAIVRTIPTGFTAPELDGRLFLVTGTGKYFKNVQYDPAKNLGIVRLAENGAEAEVLWGFSDGGKFTSEFPAHMMSHVARMRVNPENRVVMHCHPANLLAMTYVHDLDEKTFTRTLWQMCTECIVVFPDGVNVLPWMLCGTNEIGVATAKKMETARLVVWAQHGVYGAGRDFDETFGLIETAEKAAEIWMKIAHLPLKNTITDAQMHELEAHFGVKAREGYLN
jgi:rhamnulose-1-phosphate aldolase